MCKPKAKFKKSTALDCFQEASRETSQEFSSERSLQSSPERALEYSSEKEFKELGQGSVEFALVMVAFLAIILGLSAFWKLSSNGVLMSHAVSAASHHIEGNASSLTDIFAY